ncbi:MAG: glutathione peroxidase [Myxococcales bacterium]|nr:glutathione peroxidase [Myxococcales bacterium]MDH5307946.1 glutathione peroxidase [Myxococcales bacterium]MDH5565575.1 glutathione peroxidase [Myxococcales bacterium]
MRSSTRVARTPRWACPALFLLAALIACAIQAAPEKRNDVGAAPLADFTLKRLDGKTDHLGAYRGQVLLIVNVASECGYTPQYAGLQSLYERYRERGFAVLGFPSNDFGKQEPGSNDEIAKFCRANYGVEFPMFSKCAVLGDDAHPLYRELASRPSPIGGPVTWNFEKFLVDREGRVIARFEPDIEPGDTRIARRIEALLDAPRRHDE